MDKEVILKYLNKNIEYNKKTGILFWKKKIGRGLANQKCGNIGSDGYVRLGIMNKSYKLHRIIWLLENNSWPEKELDHLDGNKNNNKIENLRDVSKRVNLCNFEIHRKGKQAGVVFDKKKKLYRSRINYNKTQIYLGRYKQKEKAVYIYQSIFKIIENGEVCLTLLKKQISALRLSLKD